METVLVLIAALLLDRWLGETPRFHPLVGFGNRVKHWENIFYPGAQTKTKQLIIGGVSWIILTTPLPLFYFYTHSLFTSHWLLMTDALVLYFAIGLNSLEKHALQVYQPLLKQDVNCARQYCSYMVSRDTSELSEQEISRAVTESVLENGHDAVIASLFWYLVGGAPLVILHRLANTLDAMWGYRNKKYRYWGKVSARMDDLLGYPSAKVTALLYAMQGNFMKSLNNARQQSRNYKSLNGGWAMASGATALNIQLGGNAKYFGQTTTSVPLGEGRAVESDDIPCATALVDKAAWLFVLATTAFCLVGELLSMGELFSIGARL